VALLDSIGSLRGEHVERQECLHHACGRSYLRYRQYYLDGPPVPVRMMDAHYWKSWKCGVGWLESIA